MYSCVANDHYRHASHEHSPAAAPRHPTTASEAARLVKYSTWYPGKLTDSKCTVVLLTVSTVLKYLKYSTVN